jgi:hypothetical protein
LPFQRGAYTISVLQGQERYGARTAKAGGHRGGGRRGLLPPMGRDESGTLARLREHRKQRFEPTLARHGGRLVKLTGDGALAEFPSAVDALGAAIEFQQAMAEANRDPPEGTRIVFRIGLHLGDLIVDGDDLYGDSVNVAARPEAEAAPGEIVISGNVYDAVVGRLKVTFEDLGRLALKNIERPVQAFRAQWIPDDWRRAAVVAPAGSVVAAAQSADVPLALPDKPSIAVLPFQNMSGDPEQDFFADGIVDDIITELSRFRSLFVIARNSTFTYKGIRDHPTAPRSPWQNGHAERLIGSIRRECLDHIVVFGETHLRRILAAYTGYYNGFRTHLSLNKDPPGYRPVQRFGQFAARPILGGLHHQYCRI